jgi:hypothetical protein
MAQYREHLASRSGWLHELAKAEMNPEASELLDRMSSYDPQQLIEESTVEFLTDLRQSFNDFAKVFNGYSDEGQRFQDLKIYGVAQTAADFMIFRNQVKLVVANPSQGLISIQFHRHRPQGLSIDGRAGGEQNSEFGPPHEIMAQVGPFRDVKWTYQGENVTPEQVAKYYFAEFVRVTRQSKRAGKGNQQLLDQIRGILQEKGFDL